MGKSRILMTGFARKETPAIAIPAKIRVLYDSPKTIPCATLEAM